VRPIDKSNCHVGDFLVLLADGGPFRSSNRVFPNYAIAESEAKVVCRANPGSTVYIAQISGQLRAAVEVVEVHSE